MGAGSPFIEIPFEYLEKGIMAIFERKGADVVEMNLKAYVPDVNSHKLH